MSAKKKSHDIEPLTYNDAAEITEEVIMERNLVAHVNNDCGSLHSVIK
jgi:hypothetical protein